MPDAALILVDLQNDFLPGGALAVPSGDDVLPVARRLSRVFPLVVATQDWHPAGHDSFASGYPGRVPGDVVECGGLPQVLWPDHCVQETDGAEFSEQLDPAAVHHVVRKGTNPQIDSYSGFFDNGHQQSTGLDDLLREAGVQRVFVLGLATDYCVKFTALDARTLGYETTLIVDGCRGVDLKPGDCEQAISEMKAAGIIVCESCRIESENPVGEQ